MHHCIPHPTQHNRQRYFYWEAIECLRKSVLMGFAVFFQPGSLMQLVLVMVLTVLYGFILALLNPYKSAADDRLAITQQVLLFFTLLGGLMVKFQRGFKSTGLYEEGYSEEFISIMLTISVAAAGVTGGVAVFWAIVREGGKEADDREAATGDAVKASNSLHAQMVKNKLSKTVV